MGQLFSSHCLHSTGFNDVIQRICKIPLFTNIPQDLIVSAISSKVVQIKQCQEGDYLFKQHDLECSSFYLLISGGVMIIHNGVKLHKVCDMSLIGDIGFFHPTDGRSVSVRAISNSFLLEFNEKFLESLGEQKLLFYKNLVCSLAKRVIESNKYISGILGVTKGEQKIHLIGSIQ